MISYLDSMKGRAVAALVLFLTLSHLAALLVYISRSEDANNLLHDALVADQIALVAKLVEKLPDGDRARILGLIDAPSLHVTQTREPSLNSGLPEGTRPHIFEHLLGIFMNRPIAENVRLAYSEKGKAAGLLGVLVADAGERVPYHEDLEHMPQRALEELASAGLVQTELRLEDGSWLKFEAPIMSVSPFSTWKFGLSMLVGLMSVLAAASWVMIRWTQPLTAFAHAAERLGADIKATPLPEEGPREMRAAAGAFNRMQERLRRLIDDRTQLAAAIAHDLGTPVTRLRLRAEEIESLEQRTKILEDLAQMQRMISATLDFARQDLASEALESADLTSILQSICDDFADMNAEIKLEAPVRATARLRPIAVRRAISNVIENALKYGTRADVRLTQTGTGYTITVDDAGPGIPEGVKAEAFKPFRRLGSGDDKQVPGAGLGLTTARTIARDHGGDVELMNRAEGGLRVAITLPRIASNGTA